MPITGELTITLPEIINRLTFTGNAENKNKYESMAKKQATHNNYIGVAWSVYKNVRAEL